MNAALITGQLLDYISDAFYVSSVNDIKLDESLIEQEVIDSMGLVEIVSFVERRFGCRVADDELNHENFGSVNRMVRFILAKTAVKAEAT